MTRDSGSVDIFEAGAVQFALRSGKIKRITPCRSDDVRDEPDGFAIVEAAGHPPRLVFPGRSENRILLQVEEHGCPLELVVDRVMEVNAAPEAVVPANVALSRLCGAVFVAGMVGWRKDFILLLTLDPLVEKLRFRRKHAEE